MKKNIDDKILLKNIEEGIIVVDNDGSILDINPKAKELLNLSDSLECKKYYELFNEIENDEFHQIFLDAVKYKEFVRKENIKYKRELNDDRVLYVTSSSIRDDNGNQYGVIISFDDVTIREKLKQKNADSSFIFVGLVGFLCIWMFACSIWLNAENRISSTLFGRIIMYTPLLFIPLLRKRFGLSLSELGLKYKGIKKYVRNDALFTLGAVLLMCLIKILVMKLVPDFEFYCADRKFFDFTKYSIGIYVEYFICVIAQEFLSRGLVYELIKRIITTGKNKKYADILAIIVSSMYFAALHIYLGVAYMIGAFVLLSLFGIIYRKQRSIWGLCIPHFVLGQMLGILGFVIF